MTSYTPGWFSRALATPFDDRRVEVGGASIHYLYWEGVDAGSDKPGLVFVHGNGAHAHWWTFIAPFFLTDYRVVALDLSGAGDSGYREHYTPEQFAEEVVSVAADAGFGDDTIVVGHSFGGFITLWTGLRHRERLEGIVLVDSAVRPPDFKWERDPRRSPIKPKRYYETFEGEEGTCQPAGSLDHIDACGDDSECSPGMMCVEVEAVYLHCRRLCDLDDPNSDADCGGTCVPFADQGYLWPGAGYCKG